jgi:4-amino-4-deoxy-L-arabinose transferase-like glycosyltransferase
MRSDRPGRQPFERNCARMTLDIGNQSPNVSDRIWFRGLVAIAVVGLVWRLAYVVLTRNDFIGGDAPYYHYGALYLVDGHGFVTLAANGKYIPNAFHPPAWIVALSVPTALGLRSWLSHQIVAAMIGTFTIVATGVAGGAAFGRRTGLIAAALVAVYPNVWLYERELAVETLTLAGIAVTIALAYKYRAAPGWPRAIGLGALIGLLALMRSELITLTVFLLLPIVLSTSSVALGTRVRWLAAAGAACALVISPWAIYNTERFHHPVTLSTSFGPAIRQGSCPVTYSGELLGYFSLSCLLGTPGISQNQAVAESQYRHIAIDFIRAHPSQTAVVAAARVGRTFGLYRPLQQVHLDRSESRTDLWVLRLGLYMYWAMLPLAAVGIAMAKRERIPVFPLLAFPSAVLVAAVLTIGETRYRAPAELTLVLLASLAIDTALAHRSRRGENPRLSKAGTTTSSRRDRLQVETP